MTTGFADTEYEIRLSRAQMAMARHEFGALLLTTEADIRYFSGFLTRFWESPSRSWFLVVPASGKPIAVIPSIGAALMSRGWVDDIRTWPAPQPDDDGVSLLAETLKEVGGPVAVPSGYETHLRMPLSDYHRVQDMSGLTFCADDGLMADLRAIKSPAEIAKIANSCAIAGRAFDRMGEVAQPGTAFSDVFRGFQRLLLDEGADWVPYLAGGAGPLGYSDVISPADDRPLAQGDVLMVDTGAVRDGYFCDYDRNFAIGQASEIMHAAHARLIEAAQAAFDLARPGVRACELWQVMAGIAGGGEEAGRLGHGLGMQLTEGLSLTAQDQTVLQPGMVITLEPGTETAGGCMLVHEENIVITDTGAQALSPFRGPALEIL